jgi:hypothetical protein
LVIGGFAAARSLTNDEALPPAEKNSNVSFVDTWISTDVDGRTRTMVIQPSAAIEDAYEITVHDDQALVCSGAPSTMTGTGRMFDTAYLVIRMPVITCDDGSEPEVADGFPPLDELLVDPSHDFTPFPDGPVFEHDPETDTLTNYSALERLRRRPGGGLTLSGRTLVWARSEAENRIGDVGGWVTYGDGDGIWARDLTSPGDPAERVLLSSTPGTPTAWSRDGSKLLVVRDDLFVVSSDGTETRLTDANDSIDGGSLSPDGTAVVYATTRECWWENTCGAEDGNPASAIYVVDTAGGSPQVLLTSESRRYPDDCGSHTCMSGRFETALQEPKWSPDGSQIAYFDGMFDWGNSLRIMDSDGTDSRVLVENGETLGGGHVEGIEWSPDGSRLAFSVGQHLYLVGVDGSGFRLVAEEAVEPYWSPDGTHIAYTRPDDDGRGSLEIVRLDDLQVQNFGDGGSGPWTADLLSVGVE